MSGFIQGKDKVEGKLVVKKLNRGHSGRSVRTIEV